MKTFLHPCFLCFLLGILVGGFTVREFTRQQSPLSAVPLTVGTPTHPSLTMPVSATPVAVAAAPVVTSTALPTPITSPTPTVSLTAFGSSLRLPLPNAVVPRAPSSPTSAVEPQISDSEIVLGPWRWIKVPRGYVTIGSPPDEPGRSRDEQLRSVSLVEPYYLLTTEVPHSLVTFAEAGGIPGSDNRPAANLTFDEAVNTCRTLSRLFPQLHFRLPSDVEWEAAARRFSFGPLPIPERDDDAWTTAFTKFHAGDQDFLNRFVRRYACFGQSVPQPCGQLLPNGLGLHDMGGNLWEWCESSSGSSLSLRPICGGAFSSTIVWGCRAASKSLENRSTRKPSIGFRILAELK